ncbi:topoisomerase [Chitinophaga sancti]|uniref:Topoisomerase II n=1 Tax=Chitinophaga sancti TaxID=1004 RepID=A0A1K1SEE0_9BACT|nr:topoisomerase [Chitinophaga sancti]WQD60021.1 hypothetical protein U0033_19210 [Chitinophaga sancti]WQG87849.1 hypothetical protein SR876_23255 [Chitinophaga sancti]SFW82752.1 hypothetical protein SAMN05661012_05309 [Chitinophaga sancti]
MAKRDPEKTARNKIINSLSEELKILLPEVLLKTGFDSEFSLHGKIGGKFADYIDIKNEVIYSSDHFISLWLQGYEEDLKARGSNKENSSTYDTYLLLRKYKVFKDYLFLFLERTYLRNFEALSKKRPKVEEAEIWIGQTNANYGLMVTPRFVNGQWENDKSEIRHFKKPFWSIGHVLETGLLIPNKDAKIPFRDIPEYLNFFQNVIVRASGSKYEMELAEHYSNYVINSERPENVPLLIPEFRYEGIEVVHKYRLDFTIIEPSELNKIGFELSPWSTHGHLTKTAGLTQKAINEMARNNFEKEMKKHKDFFKKHGIFALIYTDIDLTDTGKIFSDMKKYLEPKSSGKQLKLHIMEDFFNKPLER